MKKRITAITFKLYISDSTQDKFVGYESWSIDRFNTADKHWSYTLPDHRDGVDTGGGGISGSCGVPIYHNRKEIHLIITEDQMDIESKEQQRLRMVTTIDNAIELNKLMNGKKLKK